MEQTSDEDSPSQPQPDSDSAMSFLLCLFHILYVFPMQ